MTIHSLKTQCITFMQCAFFFRMCHNAAHFHFFFFFRIILEINYVIKNRNLIFFSFLLMPRNFFVVKEKIRKMAHYSFQKIVGGKLQLFTKRKIMLGDDFEFVQKIERNPWFKDWSYWRNFFLSLWFSFFLLKFMLKGEIFGLHDTKQFVNSGMGKKNFISRVFSALVLFSSLFTRLRWPLCGPCTRGSLWGSWVAQARRSCLPQYAWCNPWWWSGEEHGDKDPKVIEVQLKRN